MKFIASACFIIIAFSLFSQTTFPWNGTYGGSGMNRTYSTTVSGITMSATIVNSENVWQDASPVWFPTGSSISGGGCSGITATNQGMLLSTDWTTNTTKTITTTITFSTPVQGPVNFKLYDVNDDGSGSWADRISITGTNTSAAAVNIFNVGASCVQNGGGSVTGSGTTTLTYNSGQSSSCTCYGNNNINVGSATDCISSITILYKSGVTPTNYNNPKQYVVISNLTATIPTATPPTSITGNTNLCQGQSTTLTVVGGNTSSQWYTGSCGGTLVGTGTSITVSPASTTTYYVRNAASSCTPESSCISVNVNVNPSPSMASNTASICSGQTLNIPLTSDFGTSYSWIAAANASVTGESTTTQSSATINNVLVNTTNAAQTVIYTVTPSANGCPGTPQTVTVTVNPTPTITNAATSICSGGTLNIPLTASATSTFSWVATDNPNVTGESTTNQTSNSITDVLTNNLSTAQTVTYTVTPTAGTCPGNPQTVPVTVNPLPLAPTITPSGPTTFCPGGSVQLTSSSATGNHWSTGETTQSITVSSSGTYTLSFTDANTCISATASITITQSAGALPTATIAGGGSYCTGTTIPPVTATVTGNGPWSVNYTLNGIAQTPATGTASPINLGNAPGTYAITNVSDASCPNTASGTTTITETSLPTITSPTSTSICSGEPLNIPLTASTTSAFSWVANDNPNVTGESTTNQTTNSITDALTNNLPTAETVTYTVTPTAGTCTGNPQTVLVTVNPSPAAPTITSSGPTTFCPGGNVQLTSSSATGNHWSTGETTQSITVSSSGTYTLSFTDANTCISAVASITITQSASALPTATIAGGGSYCEGTTIPPVTASVTGNGPWTVSYTLDGIAQTPATGATSPINIGNTAGTYVITNISDASCSNTGSGTATITEIALPTMTSPASTSICSGEPLNIPLTANVTSTFSWIATDNTDVTGESTTNQSTDIINDALTNNLPAAETVTYTITPTAGTCTGNPQTVLVTVNPSPAAPTITPSGPTTFCPGGSVQLTSSNATGNLWSTGETTQSIAVSSSGTYTLSYTDANGCISAVASITITQSAGALPTATIAGGGSYCAGTNIPPVTANVTGNGPWTVSYTLDGIAQTPANGATNPIDLGNTAGDYAITNVSDASCSSAANGTATITELALPTMTSSGVASVCSGEPLNIPLTANVASSFSWIATDNTDVTGESTTNQSTDIINDALTNNLTAAETVTYTVTPTAGTCTGNPQTVLVTVNPSPAAPTITPSGPTTFCPGGSVQLTSSSATGNLWSTGETTQSITVNSSGTYTLSYTDANGCISAVASITITQSAGVLPTATIAGGGTYCVGTNISPVTASVTGNGPWSIDYTLNGIAQTPATGATSPIDLGNAAGNYAITFISDLNCSSAATGSASIVINAAPTVSVNDLSLCTGTSGTITATPSVTGGTYLWSPNGETSSSISVNPSTTSIYSVIYTLNTCASQSSSGTVTVTPNPTVSVNNLNICENQTGTLTANPSVPGGVFSWTPNGETTPSISVSPTVNTNYNVIYTLNGCASSSAAGTVTVNQAQAVSFTADTLQGCSPLTVNFTSNSNSDPNGCVWTFSNGTTVNGCNASYTFTQPGCYDVNLTTTLNGCTSSSISTNYICVEANPTAFFTATPPTLNENNPTVILENLSTGATHYNWTFGDGSSSTVFSPNHTYSGSGQTYTITLNAYSNLGCPASYSVNISYDDDLVFYVPNAFTPDGDQHNNVFAPVFTTGYDPFSYNLTIFDRWGEIIFESNNVKYGWDGSYILSPGIVQDGIYVWKISFKLPNNDDRREYIGHVNLLR